MENSRENHDQPKSSNMQIFQFVQKKFAAAGINRALATQAYLLNGIFVNNLLILIATLASSLLHAIYEAESIFDYIQAAYAISMEIVIVVDSLIIILKANTLFDLIEDCERVVNTGEYSNWITYFHRLVFKRQTKFSALKHTATKFIFYETVQLEEKLSKIAFYVVAYFTPIFATMPPLLYCGYLYLTTDLGNDAFKLSSPLW